jgi:hypothetical protein
LLPLVNRPLIDRLQRKHEFSALGTTEPLHPTKKKKIEEEEVERGGTKLPVFLVFLLN